VVGFLAPAAPVAVRRVSALVGPAPAPARAPLVAGPAAPLVGPPRGWVRTAPLTEAQLLARYPHALPGTLRVCPARKQQAMDIHCELCGVTRICYTGDLHHVRRCVACVAAHGSGLRRS